MIIARQPVVERVPRHVPDVSHTGIVIRHVAFDLAGKNALHPGIDLGELGHTIALRQILVTHGQIQPDEGHVVLPRHVIGIDLFLQVEALGQMAQQVDEHLHHGMPILLGVCGMILHQIPQVDELVEVKKVVVVVGFTNSLLPPHIDRPGEDLLDQVAPHLPIVEILVPQIGLQSQHI